MSQNTKLIIPVRLALVTGLVFLAAGSLFAQDVEQLYQKGVDEYNSAQMEDACETLKQVESQKPGYQQASVYMKVACSQVKRLYQHEEDLFNQGVQLDKQGKYADAKQAFENTIKVRVKKPKYRSQARKYIERIDARLNEEKLYQEAARYLKQGRFSEARADLTKLVQGSGPRSGDAKSMLAKVEEAERRHQQQLEAAKNQRQTPPQQPAQQGSEQSLRAGLTAFFNGEYEHAENSLSDYLTGKGPKQQLAYFFRGAAHSAQFFLSGEKDNKEKDLALQDFRIIKGQGGEFQPPKGYVSPKIMALYSQAVGAPTP